MIDFVKLCNPMVVYPLLLVGFICAVRKLTYHLYCWFPTAKRVCIFVRKREFEFYWSTRADYTSTELLRLYTLWLIVRCDKYLPIVDCERQSTKAEYFYNEGRYSGMGGFRFRYINPEAWPILFVLRLCGLLFPSFLLPSDQVVDDLDAKTATHQT